MRESLPRRRNRPKLEAAIQGTGNGLADALTGNVGANLLSGGAGADTLDGGAGNDRLHGGTGAADSRGVGGGRFRRSHHLRCAVGQYLVRCRRERGRAAVLFARVTPETILTGDDLIAFS